MMQIQQKGVTYETTKNNFLINYIDNPELN